MTDQPKRALKATSLEIAARYRRGERVQDIAVAVGLTPAGVSAALYRMRRWGMVPKQQCSHRTSRYRWIKEHGRVAGTMSELLVALDKTTVLWLLGQMSPDTTLARFVAGIVKDAYYESKGSEG